MLIIILLTQSELLSHAEAEVRIDVSIIAELESSGFHYAYNAHEGAVGMHQIRQCVINDYNTSGPGRSRPLVVTDMYDDFLSEHVANWYVNTAIPKYLRRYKIPDTVVNRLIAYNAGIGTLRAGIIPAATRAYVNMYAELKDAQR